ncbi:MAG: MBL fold metallo-hydrolase [Myxococcota bacterium]
MEITFCGAAGTVTGSKYLVTSGKRRLLVDCGLFQGLKELRLRNWSPFPFQAVGIDAVLLTHAHLDHSGAIPLLVKAGFRGRVHCTRPTRDLCEILLTDSGRLLEEEAAYAERKGYSKHKPPQPLYTADDAKAALTHLRPWDMFEPVDLGDGLRATFLRAGHILGASMILLEDEHHRVLFTGDLGRPRDPLMFPPTTVKHADCVVVESTYGNRKHPDVDPAGELAAVINRTINRGGTVVVPSFCVGRAQELLHYVAHLKAARRIPDVPVFLNSPMAQDTTDLYCRHAQYHRCTPEECRAMCSAAQPVTTVAGSRLLNTRTSPAMIIAGSGMATGGRVIHHIKELGPDPRNTILFVGFQAAGTRGASMVAGAPTVKIHGVEIPIRAEVVNLGFLSAHADADEILSWLRGFSSAPRETFVTHGEPGAAATLAQRIQAELGWHTVVPAHLDVATLPPGTKETAPKPFDPSLPGPAGSCCRS